MPVEADLLAAIKDSFNSDLSGLKAVFTGGLWDGATDRSPTYPCLLISQCQEVEPGESLEDRKIDVTFVVKANSEAAARAAERALIGWFDPNPTRPPLAWETGNEVRAVRDTTQVERPTQRVKDGLRVWNLTIPYCFNVFDEVD